MATYAEPAMAEFKAGTVDYTTVAAAQEAQFAEQQSVLDVEQSRLLAAVSLIGDLGGGWSQSGLHNPSSALRLRADPSGLANGSDMVGRHCMFHNANRAGRIVAARECNGVSKDAVDQRLLPRAPGFDFPLTNIQMLGKSQVRCFMTTRQAEHPGK